MKGSNKMRKEVKILAVLLVLAYAVTLFTAYTTNASAETIVNPMKAVNYDQLVEKLGIYMPVPEDAVGVRYFLITAGDTEIGEADFTLNGKEYTFRAAAKEMDATELSGVYFTKATDSFAMVSYCEGKITTQELTSVLFWEDKVPGICYSISCTDCEDPSALIDIAQAVFVPMQDECDGYMDYYSRLPDLSGMWENEDSHRVILTSVDGSDRYDAVVSIVRLTQFEGTGKLDPVHMELTLEGPGEGTVHAEFHAEEDGTYTLHITDSQWSLLESETVFTGFTKLTAEQVAERQ